jgi:N-acetylneuraminic acid mutarotase
MQKQTTSHSAFFTPRALLALLLCGVACSILTGTLLGSLRPEAPAKVTPRILSFAERVAYQRAIEDVYWRHRIWPRNRGERPDAKPSLDAVMSSGQVENKVADYLRKSQALEDYWQRPLTAEQLQAEMDRMAAHTKEPEVLRELFAALGNDPFVIAECLARPALAERLLTDWYAYDERIHGDVKGRAEAELQAHPTIEQLKQTLPAAASRSDAGAASGNYREIELVKSEIAGEEANQGVEHGLKLDSRRWDETVQKLAATFGERRSGSGRTAFESADMSAQSKNDAAEAYETIPTGKLSTLQEDEAGYYATAVIEKTSDRLKLATVAWPKEPLESWIATAEEQVPAVTAAPGGSYTLPTLSGDTAGCVDDTWAPSSMNAPIGRWNHTAVWTGSEMIVWGGENLPVIVTLGGRYNPTTDTWTTVSTNGPSPRTNHTAVWTGTEMIVWGGFGSNGLNTGGRYNPSTNRWLHTATANAPSARSGHTAIWTGSQMIVWGGGDNRGNPLNTGGSYNPSTNTWTATSTSNAPSARGGHSAVWTGARMIVWGGCSDYQTCFNTGGRYNPGTNTWTATTTTHAPISRHSHTAVWTGSEMIVWGGLHDDHYAHDYLNTGGRYNPTTNTWSATSTTNAPVARYGHTALWAGSNMIVWAGASDTASTGTTGAKYHPATNSWTAISTTNGPPYRWHHTAVWTGSEMIVWGGSGDHAFTDGLSTGGRYNPANNTWATTNGNAPTSRRFHTAVWTGTEMIVWGGEDDNHVDLAGLTNSGGRYHPSTDNWTRTSLSNAPSARADHSTVWTGSEMIVWGGGDYFGTLTTGRKYNPMTNSWAATSTANAPSDLYSHTAVWTGSEMVIWGSHYDLIGNLSNAGGRYNPTTNRWAAISTSNAPTARAGHTAVWSGNRMIIWGGTNGFLTQYYNTGGRYNPTTNAWTATSTSNAPTARYGHTALWTGSEMIIWGGGTNLERFNTGGIYNPSTNAWTATSTTNAPADRGVHTAVWTGSEMIIWSGEDNYFAYGTGGRYSPVTNSWSATSTTDAPTPRSGHTAAWTGSEMIVWGGFSATGGPLDTGGIYCAQSATTPFATGYDSTYPKSATDPNAALAPGDSD